ncbi:hypothetical protein WME98_24755 [Sorangium sp. So ce296]|uniref:hypothetical protein n=1 Tax=Sorangium sp. So ce296 TaxID=3133296 RepID=UPI003F603BFE
MGMDSAASLDVRDQPAARFAGAEREALVVAELAQIDFLGERPVEEGRIVHGGGVRIARFELTPDDARGGFSGAVGHGDDRTGGQPVPY